MEKCKKFEELFINNDENVLLEHIQTCEECRQIYEKMHKVSKLIEEVKPHYIRKRSLLKNIQKFAAVFVLVLFTSVTAALYSNEDFADMLVYGNTFTAEDYGFPVDSYGLIMVD